jgi:tyrosinase
MRREIRDLERDYPEQWNLYLLGLATFQWTPQNDSLSYYNLASKFFLWDQLASNVNVKY